jgi:hypothetical protein
MPDLTLTLTDAQIKVLRRMDTTKTAKQVLQAHVDTFLLGVSRDSGAGAPGAWPWLVQIPNRGFWVHIRDSISAGLR